MQPSGLVEQEKSHDGSADSHTPGRQHQLQPPPVWAGVQPPAAAQQSEQPTPLPTSYDAPWLLSPEPSSCADPPPAPQAELLHKGQQLPHQEWPPPRLKLTPASGTSDSEGLARPFLRQGSEAAGLARGSATSSPWLHQQASGGSED